MSREYYKSDRELDDGVKQLNLLFHESLRYNRRKARKEHLDSFGVKIKPGEGYYCREFSGGFGQEIKLSVDSMEKLCGAVLFNNHFLADNLADRLKEVERPARSSGYYVRLQRDT